MIPRVCDGQADLVQPRGPGQQVQRILGIGMLVEGELAQQVDRQVLDPVRLLAVHMVAFHELRDGRVPHVMVVEAPEQVVQDALPHGAGGRLHASHLQLGEDGGHDGEAAR